MIAELHRCSLGRVLLHLIAMLGDRAVRFHAAGIARELSWVAGAKALLAQLRTRLVDALTLYLAQPVKHFSPSIAADTQSLSALLRHGYVLLTEGNTRMAALVRGITRSPWTHVSMYVGPLEAGADPRCIVEARIVAGATPELSASPVDFPATFGLDHADASEISKTALENDWEAHFPAICFAP